MDKQTTGIVFLILNLFIPGLGTVIWGNRTHGIIQLVLTVTVVLAIVSWVWALISSLKFMGVMKA